MKFEAVNNVQLLWLLPVVIAVFFIGFQLRKKQLRKLGNNAILAVTAPAARPRREVVRGIIYVAVLTLLTVALMRPQWGYEWIVKRDRGSDLVIVVDVSKSMNASDFRPSRMIQAKRELIDLVGMLRGERVALIAFAGFSQLLCPLTLDYDAFTIFLDYLDTDLIPVQGTNLGAALNDAISAFEIDSARAKNVLVITDGEDHEQSIETAIEKAKANDIKISVLGLGSRDGAPIPLDEGGFKKDDQGNLVLSKLDGAVLANIAESTGGRYVLSVPGDRDLAALYGNGISRDLGDEGEQEEKERRYFDRFQIFVALALLLLFIDSISLPRLRTLPIALIIFSLTHASAVSAGPLRDGVKAYEDQDYNQAFKNFVEGQVEDPNDPQIQYNLGNTLYRLGRFEEAAEAFKKAEKSEDRTLKQNTLFNHGNALLKNQQYKEAIDKYEQAIDLNDQDVDAVFNRDLARQLLKQQEKRQQQKNDGNEGDKQQNQDNSGQADSQQRGDNSQQQQQDADNQAQQDQQQNQQPDQQGERQQTGDSQQSQFEGGYSDNPDEQEARQWLSTVEENAKQSLQRSLRSRMWKKTPPTTDW